MTAGTTEKQKERYSIIQRRFGAERFTSIATDISFPELKPAQHWLRSNGGIIDIFKI